MPFGARHRAPHLGLLVLRLAALACGLLALWHPAWVRQEQIAQRPVLAVVLDDSASMALASGNSPEGKPQTRFEDATQLLTRRLLPVLELSCELEIFDVAGRAIDQNKLPRTAEGTNDPLTETLLQLQQSRRDRSPAGIVLLSDGREVADRPTSGELEKLHTPVHVVQFVDDAGPAGPPNVAIRGVATNRRALLGNTVRVAVDLAGSGVPEDTSLSVAILDAERPVATKKVSGGFSAERIELDFVPRRAGDLTYAVQAGAAAGELNLVDNRQTFRCR